MKYVKVQVQADDGDLLCEQDLVVADTFGPFVRLIVQALASDGSLAPGESVTATVIPRRGEFMRSRPRLLARHPGPAARRDWIDMAFEEAIEPGSPIRYVTVEIRPEDRPVAYRRDYRLEVVAATLVSGGLEESLISLGLLKPGEKYKVQFFAHDDAAARLDRDRFPPLQRRAAALVELLPEAAEPPPPCRSLASFPHATPVGQPEPGDVHIFVHRSALEELRQQGRLSVEVERGGLLIGQVYRESDDGRPLVDIRHIIVSNHGRANRVEFCYTLESWLANGIELREKYPGRRVVGWYHTHLVEIAYTTAEDTLVQTKLFFSVDDLFLHRHFFPEKWYVALVLDPQGNGLFFQWKGGDVAVCRGYHVYGEQGCPDSLPPPDRSAEPVRLGGEP